MARPAHRGAGGPVYAPAGHLRGRSAVCRGRQPLGQSQGLRRRPPLGHPGGYPLARRKTTSGSVV
eukprot:9933869-Alexandrium_andersonii.AAC.1